MVRWYALLFGLLAAVQVVGAAGWYTNGTIIAMNMENDITDEAGNFTPVIAKGSEYYGTGWVGQGFDTNGENTINTTVNDDFDKSVSGRTLNMWVNIKKTASSAVPLAQWRSDDGHRGTGVFIETNTIKYYHYYGTASNQRYILTCDTALGTAKWGMITVTYNDSTNYCRVYLNGTLCDDDNGCNGLQDVPQFVTIGSVSRDFSAAYNGTVDEVVLWRQALTTAQITELFNLYVNGNQYPFAPQNPNLSLSYPTNGSRYNFNTWNGSFLIGSDIAVSDCDINESGWTGSQNNASSWLFVNNTAISDGTQYFTANCSTAAGGAGQVSFLLTLDTVSPSSTLDLPANGATYTAPFYLNLSYYDLNLFRTNTTIWDANGTVLYTNYSGDLSGVAWYNITTLVNISNGSYPAGVYTLGRTAADTHTASEFKEPLDITVDDKADYTELTYKLSYGDVVFKYPPTMTITTTTEKDRYAQTYISEKVGAAWVDISADRILYLPHSPWPCHFILNANGMSGYWYDCEGLDKNAVVQQLDKRTYRIWFNFTKTEVGVRSLGGLNEYAENTTFIIAEAAVETGVTCLECLNTSINCSLDYAENSTGYFLKEKYCGGDEDMYYAAGFIMLGVIGGLILILTQLDLGFMARRESKDTPFSQMPFMKYLALLLGAWGLVAVTNVAVTGVSAKGLALANTMNGFYGAVMWTVILTSIFAVLFFLFHVMLRLGWIYE